MQAEKTENISESTSITSATSNMTNMTHSEKLADDTDGNKKHKITKAVKHEPANCLRLFWDLETTGKQRSRIVSIGYVAEDERLVGELLVLPKVDITTGAAYVHGYSKEKLMECNAKSSREQLEFWMEQISNLKTPVVMVAHNGKSFDTHVLRHEMVINGLEFAQNIVGFVDSLHWFKYHCDFPKANIDYLLSHCFNRDARDIHGACEDSRILKEIVVHILQKRSESQLTYFEDMQEFLERTSKWCSEEEIIRDIHEELIFAVEQQCTHERFALHDDRNVCSDCGKIWSE